MAQPADQTNRERQRSALFELRAIMPTLSPTLLTAAKWLTQATPDTLQNASSGSISRETGVSKASLVRLCQALGYQGFGELKTVLVAEKINLSATRGVDGRWNQTFRRAQEEILRAFEGVASVLDEAMFAKAVLRLASAAQIYWIGRGETGKYAEIAETKCLIAGLRARVMTETQQIAAVTRTLDKGDVVVLLSQFGTWDWVNETLDVVRANGTPCVAFTRNADSRLAKEADCTLLTPPVETWIEGRRWTLRAIDAFIIEALILAVKETRDPDHLTWG